MIQHPRTQDDSARNQQAPFERTRRIVIGLAIAACLLLALPVPVGMTPAAHRLIAVTVLMAGLWGTQAIPLAATSLIPLALFPFLGIMTAESVGKAYVNDTLFLYVGGMIIALGIERWNLHRRIALNLVNVIGVSPRQLVLGFLVTTAGLSMWISNTACAMLMLPIALAMLKTLDDSDDSTNDSIATASDGARPPVRRSDVLAAPLLLAIAYASSLGGMTTLVGTPTNNAAVGIYRKQFADAPDLTVANWLLVAGPIGLVYLAVTWLVLIRGLPGRQDSDNALRIELRRRLKSLGKATTAERRMLIVFVVTGALWICREPLIVQDITILPGWSGWYSVAFNSAAGWLGGNPFPEGKWISDSTVALAMAVLLFLIPAGRDSGGQDPAGGRRQPLMNWETANRLPWDMILLFGGGFALADAFRMTELSGWLGAALQGPLSSRSPWVVVASLCLLMTFLTEFTSNVATVSTLMPTLLSVAIPLGLDPRMVLIPTTLAASCAFMMPIATPPNAIVFGSGRVPMRVMFQKGLILNLVGIPILTCGAFWIIRPLLGIP